MLSARRGSSPRGRGKPEGRLDGPEGTRLIPARAGKTAASRPADAWESAHPRAGGENAIEVSGKSRGDFHAMINGDVRVIVAQHEAMSEGVDGLQRVCHTEIWLSQSNSLVINEQATGRLNRQGQTQPVNRFLIQAIDTVDDRVLGRLQERFDKLKASGLI